MKTKKLFALVLAICLLPVFGLFAKADNSTHCYIDGENISCGINMAVIYTGIESTGQSLWCHNIVVDADGSVTDIFEGGSAADISVPEGGGVICATGTRVQWFRDNVRKGKKVFFDRFTSRLFVYDQSVMFDPYFSKTVSVTQNGGNYLVSSTEYEGIPVYSYTIFVNGSGIVVPKESSEEGAFSISAGTVDDKNFLRMYAPVGAKCTVSDGTATLTYDQTMLNRSLSLSVNDAKEIFASLCGEYAFFDRQSVEDIILSAEGLIGSVMSYRDTSALIVSLNEMLNNLSVETGAELRGALHTPAETDDSSVYATLSKIKESGLNSVSLRLTNGYGTFLPLPDGMEFSQDEKFKGFDLLASYVKNCKTLGLTLDVTVDVFFNDHASATHPSWVTKTNSDTEEGVSSKFFSPASEEFRNYFVSYIDFLVSHYDIHSLSLDYIRYPRFSETCDYGYDDNTLQLFASTYGHDLSAVKKIGTELFLSPLWNDWIAFKRGLVSDTVRRISETVRAKQSDVYINAYVSPDIVDYYYMQDSRTWLENNWVDGITLALFDYDGLENDAVPPLAYLDNVISKKSEVYGGFASDSMYFVAINSKANLTTADIAALIKETRTCGAIGFLFSDLESLYAQNYVSDLSVGILEKHAISPFSTPKDVAKSLLEFSKNRITNNVLPNLGCTEEVAADGYRIINEYLALLETEDFTVENADNAYLSMAAAFATSEAKDAVLEEFRLIRKLASLQKEPADTPLPPPDISAPDVSEGSDVSVTIDESSQDTATGTPSSSDDFSYNENEGKAGEILGYCFVGLALAAGIGAMVIGIKRRKK